MGQKKEYPDLPFILMGHSMGSLVVRTYAKEHDRGAGCVDCVRFTEQNYLRPLGAAVGHASGGARGRASEQSSGGNVVWFVCIALCRREEPICLVLFGPGRWCGEGEENPLCGFTFSDDAFFALNDLLKETYGFHGWHCTNRKLPVLFLSGGDDPCYVNGGALKKPLTICG